LPTPRSDIDRTRIESVVLPICRAHGVELVDVVYAREPGGAVLRILIDRERPELSRKPGSGVTLEDCKAVSRDVGTALDVHEDALPASRYRLEVGSPGLDRPLVKPEHFARFTGSEAKIHTRCEVAGAEAARRNFKGTIRGLVDGAPTPTVRLEDGGQSFDIPLSSIQKAHLVPQFS
jgi:ribosome maturation factor RimP